MAPDWVPKPLPGNEDTFQAFRMIKHCRGAMSIGFDWNAVATRLELHGLWTPTVERGLDICEAIMVREEQKAREREKSNPPKKR